MTGTTRIDDAYAALYQEHNARLIAYARSLTGNQAVAEDLAAEAHFRVWRRMSAGHAVDNPSAYLTTTVRNLAAGLGRAQREIARDLDELPQDAERAETVAEDPEQRASHVDLISRLLKELPERWAKALWYAEVEDLPMEAVGARIGASASTTAVVLTRARERLRQAFLQSQPGRPADEACEPYWKQIPTIVRGTASARRSRTVLEHSDGCADCRTRMLALTEANTRLPLLLGPALFGIVLGGGAWFLPAVAGAGAGAAAGTAARTVARAGSRAGTGARHARISARARLARHSVSPAKVTVYGSATAAVAIAVAVATMALGSPNPPSRPNAAAAQSQASAQPTAAALPTAQSPAAATTPAAAKQAAAVSTPTSSAAAPGTTTSAPPVSAADVAVAAQRETLAAAADPTTSTSPVSTPTPATTTTSPAASSSSTAAATMVAGSPTATASSTLSASSTPSASASPTQSLTLTPTPSPSQTPGSPSPSPTITPTQASPTDSGPTSAPPTSPYCEFSIYGCCVIW